MGTPWWGSASPTLRRGGGGRVRDPPPGAALPPPRSVGAAPSIDCTVAALPAPTGSLTCPHPRSKYCQTLGPLSLIYGDDMKSFNTAIENLRKS